MDRPKIKVKNLNIRLDPKMYSSLQEFSDETGLTKTKTVEKALIRYFEHYRTTGRL